MTKLLRVYNKEDKMANKGNVYFGRMLPVPKPLTI
jgi:hypothetical protein